MSREQKIRNVFLSKLCNLHVGRSLLRGLLEHNFVPCRASVKSWRNKWKIKKNLTMPCLHQYK